MALCPKKVLELRNEKVFQLDRMIASDAECVNSAVPILRLKCTLSKIIKFETSVNQVGLGQNRRHPMAETIKLMQGNEACTMAAIAAGLRFYAGYPITPSTEIAEMCWKSFQSGRQIHSNGR